MEHDLIFPWLLFFSGAGFGIAGGAAMSIYVARNLKALLKQLQGCLVTLMAGCAGIGFFIWIIMLSG